MSSNIFKQFNQIWDQLSQDSKNNDLKNAIRSWYQKLSLEKRATGFKSEDCIEYIFEFLSDNPVDCGESNQVIRSSFEFYRKLDHNDQINQTDFENKIKESITQIQKEKNQPMIKIIVLIAFILAGVGLLLFFLKKKEKQESIEKRPSTDKILVLVIDANKHKSILNYLQESKNIQNKEDGKNLYNATKYLWIGTQTEYEKSDFDKWFSESEVTEESEYDIMLVKIQVSLNDLNSLFCKNVVNRLPAFEKLHEFSGEVKVSKRLPSKAYENDQLYK